MGLDMWFRDDVARLLASTQETLDNSLGAVTPLDPGAADAYRRGFADAVRAMAVAFGVSPPGGHRVTPAARAEMLDARPYPDRADGWSWKTGW